VAPGRWFGSVWAGLPREAGDALGDPGRPGSPWVAWGELVVARGYGCVVASLYKLGHTFRCNEDKLHSDAMRISYI